MAMENFPGVIEKGQTSTEMFLRLTDLHKEIKWYIKSPRQIYI